MFSFAVSLFAQITNKQIEEQNKRLEKFEKNIGRQIYDLHEKIENESWYSILNEVADIEKYYITGGRYKEGVKNQVVIGDNSDSDFPFYIFIPVGINLNQEYPLVIFPFGGDFSNYSMDYANIIQELIYQQYIVVAPDFGGGSVYGNSQYDGTDKNGGETDLVDSVRSRVLGNYDFIDDNRVGIIGWSDGGVIALNNYFNHPDTYNAAFAGVPVNDLLSTFGYYLDYGRGINSTGYPLGATVHGDGIEFGRRPSERKTEQLQNAPLLIHTNTKGKNGGAREVEKLVNSLRAKGGNIQSEIFSGASGGFSFNSKDVKSDRETRLKIWKFISKYLKPEKPITKMEELLKAEEKK